MQHSYHLLTTIIGLVVFVLLVPELAAIFMVRDYDPTNNYNNLLDRVIRQRDAMISLKLVCISS
jgi:hypothetical protein